VTGRRGGICAKTLSLKDFRLLHSILNLRLHGGVAT
jgi:hypothetical protein